MEIKELVAKMDGMVARGEIVDAVGEFFAEDAQTSDYQQVTTANKRQMLEKMVGFTDAIERINGITLHRTIVDGLESASEFTFDFQMKDNTAIYWHEIIRRIWNKDGQVVHEEYFNA